MQIGHSTSANAQILPERIWCSRDLQTSPCVSWIDEFLIASPGVVDFYIIPLEPSILWKNCSARGGAGVKLDGLPASALDPRPRCRQRERGLEASPDYLNQKPLHGLFISFAPLHSRSLCDFFCSVVPQTTVILNNDRQNSIVAKMVGQEEPLSRAADSLENILSKLVAFPGILPSSPPWAGPVSKAIWWENRGMLEVTMRGNIEPGLG